MAPLSGAAFIILDYVVPSLGTVVSFLLFISPLPRVLAVRRRLVGVMRSRRSVTVQTSFESSLVSVSTPVPQLAETEEHNTVIGVRDIGALGTGDSVNAPRDRADGSEAASDSTRSEVDRVAIPIIVGDARSLADNKSSSAEMPTEDKVLGVVNPLPYPLMLGNAIAWISYGFVESDYFVFWSNAPGMVLCLFYVAVAYAALRLDEWRARQVNSGEHPLPEIPPVVVQPQSRNWRWWTRPTKESCLFNRRNANGTFTGVIGNGSTDAPVLNNHGSVDAEQPAFHGVHSTGLVRSDTTESLLPKAIPVPRRRRSWMTGMSTRRLFEAILFVVAIVLVVSGFFVYIPLASNGIWHNQNARVLVAGLVANILLGFMYSSPLFLIRTIFQTRDASIIDRNLALMSLINGTLWTAYGFAKREPFIYVLNILGASLGAIQLLLLAIYSRKRAPPKRIVAPPELEPVFATTPAQVLNVAQNEPPVLESSRASDGSLTLVIAEGSLNPPVTTAAAAAAA
ncbi:hypothetical protein F1559_005069 [Cyanidiococcus yangmingshanensis]|uniref:Sugar transporter n=1 Tax=Cyanidiococcus yangmingshanensis TaxID=2690220 RepID=A0A7J7IQS1_9RHOD|nr:hypothetical protein F1559_005069 [Cyanidiococcus yangmingshanensis]